MSLLRIVALAAVSLLSAGATVVVALVGAGQLPAETLFDACVAWLALGTVVGPVVRELGAARELRVERKVQVPLALAFRRLHEATAIPYKELGLHAYLVRGWWPLRHLVSVGRLRLSARETSGVRWTKGKGVIGAAWESGRFGYEIARAEPRAFKLGGRDQRRVREYEAVAANPILRGGKVVGCVAVDAPTEFADRLIADDENRRKVKRELGELAAGIANLL